MSILFRSDSSSSIGTGHVMRDLVLADRYAKDGENIIFSSQNLDGNINKKVEESGYELEILNDNSFDEFQILIDKYKPKMVVIDHYGIDDSFEKRLKIKNTQIKILSFDDTYEKHYCDILLNHNISADKKRYKDLVPAGCELRCGSEYTLLRDEFIEQKRSYTIFLAMGGTDHSDINIDILEVIKEFNDLNVNLVTTTANKNLEKLKEYVQSKDWIDLHINSDKIAKLMKNSDFAIVTPSVTLNEIFFMELPFIAIRTAKNQEDMANYLRDNNHIILDKFQQKDFKESIKMILKPTIVNFIDLSLSEKKMVLDWRNKPSIKNLMFNKDSINIEEHINFIDSLSEKKDRTYFLVKELDRPIGVIDFTDITKSKANIGLYAKPDLRGVGKSLMRVILDYGLNTLGLKSLISEVYDDNHSAIKLYKKFGFKEMKKIDNLITMELRYEDR